jgi:hypothetical protein
MSGAANKPGKNGSNSRLQRWLGMISACLGLAVGAGLAAGTPSATAQGARLSGFRERARSLAGIRSQGADTPARAPGS